MPTKARGRYRPNAGAVVGCLVGLLAAGAQKEHVAVAAAALALWTVFAVTDGRLGPPTVWLDLVGPSRAAVLAFAVVGLGTASGIVPATGLTAAAVALAVTTAAATGWIVAHRARRSTVRVLVAGDSDGARAQAAFWAAVPGVEVVGRHELVGGNERDAGEESALLTAAAGGVDAVVAVPGAGFGSEDLRRLAQQLESTATALVVAGVVEGFAPHRMRARTLAGIPVLGVAPGRRSPLERWAKAAFDWVAGTLLLCAITPVLALLVLAVRLDSPGPAIFRQIRVGHSGRPFVMYKLRTMRVDQPEVRIPLQRTAGNEVLFKMRDDPRITRIGSFLRRYSLDELPQLVNVVKGEMSLIGPRPALFEETRQWNSSAWRRTTVKPGVTGLWQVSGRSDLTWERSIALDLHYVDNWRLADDLVILTRTLGAVVRRSGAY